MSKRKPSRQPASPPPLPPPTPAGGRLPHICRIGNDLAESQRHADALQRLRKGRGDG